jgi:hypothetical protein
VLDRPEVENLAPKTSQFISTNHYFFNLVLAQAYGGTSRTFTHPYTRYYGRFDLKLFLLVSSEIKNLPSSPPKY